MKNTSATNPVGATRMTLRVLEGLEELSGANLTELADHLGEPMSTIHNHLETLREKNYVIREDNNYYLGLRFMELGERRRHNYSVYSMGKDEVERIAKETGELVNLAVEENGEVVYLALAKGEDAISTDTFAGKRVSMHSTALGKAMLAWMSEDRVSEIIDTHGLPSVTEHTITEPEVLFEELETIKKRGFAIDHEERGHGINCAAVPILHRDKGDVEGAISVSGPLKRMGENRMTGEIIEELQSSANVMEIELSYPDQL